MAGGFYLCNQMPDGFGFDNTFNNTLMSYIKSTKTGAAGPVGGNTDSWFGGPGGGGDNDEDTTSSLDEEGHDDIECDLYLYVPLVSTHIF